MRSSLPIAFLTALAACGLEDRGELRDAILLDDGRTAVISYSDRRVRLVRTGLLDGGGVREETVEHRSVLGRLDVSSGAIERLVAFDLGAGHDAEFLQLLWSLGDVVLLRGTFPEAERRVFDHALLDARSGRLVRLDLDRALAAHAAGPADHVWLVARDGTLAVHTANRALWLRRAGGELEKLSEHGAAERCDGVELVFGDGARRMALHLADGKRRDVHPRELERFPLLHEDRPRLLQVRGVPGHGHGALPAGGPFLALARKAGGTWLEDPLPCDVSALR